MAVMNPEIDRLTVDISEDSFSLLSTSEDKKHAADVARMQQRIFVYLLVWIRDGPHLCMCPTAHKTHHIFGQHSCDVIRKQPGIKPWQLHHNRSYNP